jgi:hypothetical protein
MEISFANIYGHCKVGNYHSTDEDNLQHLVNANEGRKFVLKNIETN